MTLVKSKPFLFLAFVGLFSRISVEGDCIPQHVKNSRITQRNQVISYQCLPGFKLSGPSKVICLGNGVFYPSIPTCEAIMCSNQYGRRTGQVMQYLPQWTRYDIGRTVHFWCQYANNRTVTDSTSDCLPGGVWSKVWPSCPITYCTKRQVHRGYFVFDEYNTALRLKINYKCLPGYYLDGPSEDECLTNGNWKNKAPECISINVYKNRCILNNQVLKYEIRKEKFVNLHCTSNIAKVSSSTALSTVTVVTITAGAIFAVLLLIFMLVIMKRRRLLNRIRRWREEDEAENREFRAEMENEPSIFFNLPSYDEAMRSKPKNAPPSFDEAVGASQSDEIAGRNNVALVGQGTSSESHFVEHTANVNEILSTDLSILTETEGVEDIVVSVNHEEAPPPYPGDRSTTISFDESSMEDNEEAQLIS